MAEALIVLLLVGLLSSMALPAFTAQLNRTSSAQDIHAIQSAIEFARAQALLLQNDVLVCPLLNSSTCGNHWQQSVAIMQCTPDSCTLLRELHLFNKNASLTASRQSVRFNKQGMAQGNNLRLTYHASPLQRDFIINNEGRLRIE